MIENNDKLIAFKKSKFSYILLGFLIAFGPLTIDMYIPTLPVLTKELNTTTSLTQLSLTACLLGLAFGQILFGSISDIYGRRKPLIIAIGLYIISSLLCVFASSIWPLIILRFIQGASGAGGMVIARSSVRDLYEGPQLTKIFSLLMLVMGIAPIIAPVIGGQLLHFTSWRGIFFALFIMGVMMIFSVIFQFPETLSTENRLAGGIKNTFNIFKELFASRLFMGFAIIQGLIMGAMFAYISGSSFVFQEIFDVTPQGYSIIFAINAAGIIIASQITGRLAGKVSELNILKFALCLAAIGSFALIVSMLLEAGIAALLIPMFLVISSVGFVNPTCTSLAMQSQGRNAGSASALIGLLQFTIGGVVAPLVGIAGSENPLPLGIIIALCVIGAIFFFINMVLKTNQSSSKNASM